MADHPIIRVGCADLPPGLRRERYFERLSYLEVEGTRYGLPRPSVLARWRSEAGEDGGFGLVAPLGITDKPGPRGYPRTRQPLTRDELAQAGGFRATELVARTVAALAQAARALRAEVVIFRSPVELSPSATNRDTLRRFFGEIAPAEAFAGTERVWEPQGLWEPEVAARLAVDMGVLYACDPLSNDPLAREPEFFAQLPQHRAYFRLTGLGRARHSFDEYEKAALAELAAAYERTWIVFAHDARYPDAIQLRQMIDAPDAEPES